VQVHRRVLEDLGVDVPVAELFGTPTIRTLARRLAGVTAPTPAAPTARRWVRGRHDDASR
jgi:hypothetical protein